ncbi:MAG: hypothetical protein K0R00_2483 [Herbinix sp.]|jgi:hypothetical protein|nr:hypothetical protein [Herbinix sp.]
MEDYSNEYFRYFIKAYKALIKNYYGKFAVIKSENNFEYFDDMEAAKESIKNYDGSCYIAECVGDDEMYLKHIYNLSQLDDLREDNKIEMNFE